MPIRARKTSKMSKGLTQEKHDPVREQILDSALALFIEFGLRRNTMDDVANRAGVGRATVYRRFGDKDSLIQAVILRECHTHLTLLEERTADIDNGLEALLEAFVLAAHMAHRHQLLERLLSTEPENILPFLSVRLGPLMQLSRTYLAERIGQAQRAGDIVTPDPDLTAEMILRLIQSLILSPGGVINPADETSLREFANTSLRPLLSPR